ncbi:MAG: HDOD domain-containing protein [Opitutaceae bacterium]|nr:HDOD domain-containing protein [Opitutaceae bacterium]
MASRVMMLTNNPDADVADLSDLIHQDQALAGNVLRIANSAAYRVGEPIVSLRQAVMQLGLGVLGEIAVAACLNHEGLRAPGYEPLRKRMLLHAFITGGFAKELARRKRRNVESMFLCGLLHSVGKTVTLRLIANAQSGAATKLTEGEVAPLIAAHQADIAARVTVAWKLPQQVHVVAVHHASPETAPEFVDETKLVALAAHIAGWVTLNDPPDEAAVRALPAWAELNFYPDDVDAVLERRAVLEESAAIFMS